MKDIMIFQRVEKKYRLSPGQKAQLLCLIGPRLTPDVHGRSTISSLYLDTPDFRIIRNSIDAKVYKEKLRLRAYGTPTMDDTVFLEIKKKYKGVVYKRRESMSLRQAMAYIDEGALPCDSQIMREIDYAMRFYGHPRPAMQISYERDAYFDGDNPNLRITFDTAVRGRQTDLGLERGTQGELLLADAAILMEIKTDGAMPCYLAHALDECAITPTHFSKYGTAYLRSTGRVAVHPQTDLPKGALTRHVCTV